MTASIPRTLLDRAVGWSPVLLLGALAALTYWLDAQIQAPAVRDGNARHDPDILVERFRAVNLGDDGRPQQVLEARTAKHFPDDGVTEFTEPRLALTYAGRARFAVEAQRGRLSGDRENVYFEGAVKAVRDVETQDGKTTGPITLSTELLHVMPREDKVTTDQPVTIVEPRVTIRATGMVLNDRDKTVVLRSDVRGTIQPGIAPK
jgi:lipopolysaccharide export system protein LptC